MDMPTIHPHALNPGDTIGIVAPAGPLEQIAALEQGVATLERLGFRVRYTDRIFHSRHYLAGEDAARAEELHRYFEDPSIQAILPLRGGYGCARLIPFLDEKRLRPHCKLFMGFSDMTTLHLYFRRRFGWITIHGPMAASAPLGSMDKQQERHLISLWSDPMYRATMASPDLESWHPGVAEGRLSGGCLSILVASLGTPYEIKTEGKILFLEDLGEEPYRLDRMLTQLDLAGKLAGVAGIVLGSFEGCEAAKGDCTAAEVLREILCRLVIPILAGFPAGHGPQNWAFPLGIKVRLDADTRQLAFLESAVI
jgi:muramoyltetrapeptide carboxypeptidase